MNDLLSSYIAGFWKLLGSQRCLLKLLENCKNTLDKGDSVGALFMDLSEAVDTINN